MPDWGRHVREHLALPDLTARREEELIRELAEQLDEVYESALAGGASAGEAAAIARAQIRDWPALARDLVDANPGSRRPPADRWIERREHVAEESRTARGRILCWIEQLYLDVLYGLRQVLAHRGFTAVALLTLALGIGVNTAAFSVVRSLLSGASTFPEPDRLVLLHARADRMVTPIAEAEYLELASRRGAFQQLAAFDTVSRTLTGITDPITARAVQCTADFAPILGLRPVLGRLPLRAEYLPGADPVAVITEPLWRRAFAGDPGVVGRSVTIDGVGYTVIGILPMSAGLETLAYTAFDVLVPLRFGRTAPDGSRPAHRVIARLAPGVTHARAGAELAGIAAGMAPMAGTAGPARTFVTQPLGEFLVPFSRRVASAALLAAVGLVLLVACLNLASMSVARTSARARELAIRAALGAGRGRIVRQLLTENVLLAAVGGVLGVLTGVWALRLANLAGDTPLYVREALTIDAGLLGYAFFLCLFAGLAFGLVPAALTARSAGGAGLRPDPGAGATSRAGGRLRNALVIGELAIGVPLLVAMGLVVRHLDGLMAADTGFRSDGIVTMRVDLPAFRYGSDAARAAFVREALDRLRAVPGIASIGAASRYPVGAAGATFGAAASVEGSRTSPPGEPDYLGYQVVTPGYIETLGVTLLRGRHLSGRDTATSGGVAVVNQRLATRYWPDTDPLGRTIVLSPGEKDERRITVVGVVADFGRAWQGGLPGPQLYVPYEQEAASRMVIVARTIGAASEAPRAMRQAIAHLDGDVPVSDVLTAADIARLWLRDDQVTAIFLSVVAALALSLGVIGLYGLMAHLVVQRTREIGVRMALGATRADVRWLVIRRSARLAAIGLAAGSVVAQPVGFAMATQRYGVSGADPVSFGLVAALLLGVSVVAAYVPSRRASRVDPIAALRCE